MVMKFVIALVNLRPTDSTGVQVVVDLTIVTATAIVFTITANPPVLSTPFVLSVLVTLMTGTDHPTIILSITMAMIWFISLTTIIGLITSLDVAADSYLMSMRTAMVFEQQHSQPTDTTWNTEQPSWTIGAF